MKQYEAVIKTMEQNGGFATLGDLYKNVFRIEDCEWKTKTPFASVRRIVQDPRFFFRIKPGLWALKSYRKRLPPEILEFAEVSKSKREEFSHTYFQGLLVEIGNLKEYPTFVPSQDKNKRFLGKKLGSLTSVRDIYQFSYVSILQRAKTVDVIWFNERKMPHTFFEIEHSTDFQSSLLKFIELQDFSATFFIVSDQKRQRQYQAKLDLSAFTPIKSRVRFMDYDRLSEWHTKTCEIWSIENSLRFQ